MTNHDQVGLSEGYLAALQDALGGTFPHPLLRTLTVRLLEHAELSSSDLKYLVVIYLYHTLSKYWQGSTSYGFRTRFLGPIGHIVLEGAYELANEIL